MFQPFGSNVLIRKDAETGTEETFKPEGLIVRPRQSRDPSEQCWGYVSAVGTGVETGVATGDHVLYRKYAENGAPCIEDGLFVLHENELLGKRTDE